MRSTFDYETKKFKRLKRFGRRWVSGGFQIRLNCDRNTKLAILLRKIILMYWKVGYHSLSLDFTKSRQDEEFVPSFHAPPHRVASGESGLRGRILHSDSPSAGNSLFWPIHAEYSLPIMLISCPRHIQSCRSQDQKKQRSSLLLTFVVPSPTPSRRIETRVVWNGILFQQDLKIEVRSTFFFECHTTLSPISWQEAVPWSVPKRASCHFVFGMFRVFLLQA